MNNKIALNNLNYRMYEIVIHIGVHVHCIRNTVYEFMCVITSET